MRQHVSSETLSSSDIEGPIADNNSVEVEDFEQSYLNSAKVADEAGHTNQALVYRLLAAICSFHFKPTDKIEPFSNKIGFADGSRTLVGSDFDQTQIDSLYSALPRIENVALRTRISDLVWTRDRSKHDCARMAITGYVDLVGKLIDETGRQRFGESSPTGVASESFLARAALIARSLGWTKSENDELRSRLLTVLQMAKEKDYFAAVRFGNLATDLHLDGVDEILNDLDDVAASASATGDFHAAESLQALSIRRARVNRDEELANARSLKLTGILEAKADAAAGSSFLQSHALQQAIDSLHGLKNVREEKQRLHEKLKASQLHMNEELGVIEHVTDLTSEVERIIAGFSGLDLLDSLRRLTFTELPSAPEKLIGEAREIMQKYPLSSLFATSLMDSDGRTVARVGGGTDNDDTIRYQVIKSEGIRTGIAVAGAIEPIRTLITKNYAIEYDTLLHICQISPFVPSGNEHAFARGMRAFLYGDDFTAATALVPLLEAGLRSMVIVAGRSDTKIMAGGIEETIGLGALLSNHRDVLEKVFTPAIIYCIENLFVHELGPKVRHNFCHGLTPDGTFFSHSHIYAVKLIFSLVMLPLCADNQWPQVKAYVSERVPQPRVAPDTPSLD